MLTGRVAPDLDLLEDRFIEAKLVFAHQAWGVGVATPVGYQAGTLGT